MRPMPDNSAKCTTPWPIVWSFGDKDLTGDVPLCHSVTGLGKKLPIWHILSPQDTSNEKPAAKVARQLRLAIRIKLRNSAYDGLPVIASNFFFTQLLWLERSLTAIGVWRAPFSACSLDIR